MPAKTRDNFNTEQKLAEESEAPKGIHTISSNVRQSGSSISVFKGSRKAPLNYEKYFVGRSYQLFRRGIRADMTLDTYKRQMYHFCEYVGKSTDVLVQVHGAYECAAQSA